MCADAKDIEYEEKKAQVLQIRAGARTLFEDIATWRKDNHVQTMRTRVLETLDELWDSQVVFEAAVGEIRGSCRLWCSLEFCQLRSACFSLASFRSV